MNATTSAADPAIDVMLLLEGTYPYVSGGVSSWVHQIINGFPELRFHLCFLGSRREDYGEARYKLPPNVVGLTEHYLFSEEVLPKPQGSAGDAATAELVRNLHEQLREGDSREARAQVLEQSLQAMQGRLDLQYFLHSKRAWSYLTEQYLQRCTDPSFVDYFWTVRTMHTPIWTLAALARSLPPARVYHTISTGYAGYLGAVLARITGRPLILSEHGIYTKERRIDLFSAQWISDNMPVLERNAGEAGYFRQLWIRLFESLGRMCYDAADPVIALYEANRLRELADGAEPATTCLIANGINVPPFAATRALRPSQPPTVMCLIGRVVPIKDVKTFIRAVRVATNRMPGLEGWIAGPEDEHPDYARECRELAESLELGDRLKFLGFQKLVELLPKVGLVVLSSISEALPLVLLEGYAAGVPAVTTDVGSCRQLIDGLGPEDEALGSAGAVVGIADAQALGEACTALLGDPEAYARAQAAGIARVERYYTQPIMFAKYRAVYEDALARSRLAEPPPRGALATALREGRIPRPQETG
ncbi:MAG: GT4 family glycosyltransferase PelF [Betaproteobacteria bacterium]|jgi:glycosyltransferase involved in cell wall biosynthesis|uniref:Putative UDP-Glycosyltransferase/glycogen phosphorylase n=1 Tax=Thiomonas delicata TaxID=364030 RepID=A0A238D5S0_THIDL|nr:MULTISPECIES: GT4 family glycosyltransferase PelF [Thiomonas]MDE2128180.1 GT4 family glycosyltransferase PelF [Betaproteobacteria bacterium]OZB43885.1 MAG: glycosyl transferase family 1 [Thiomonas sp. 15-66-11]OZB65946.1 MAG: glycosyl transferase family 1 [Thiomonas sp. 13-66-29]SBP88581.1 putative UDP-Glycosyltransferase/glycogen phosphorylase [Thiomonas delicata]